MTIQDAIAFYKNNFEKCWNDEKYKWVAVKYYREHWDIKAKDFAGMLINAFGEAANLLSGAMYYPYRMLCKFAQQNPEKLRSLFQLLYNESLPLIDRLQPFRSGCEELLREYQELHERDPEKSLSNYQDLRALCVYLSFEYPEKYFLYKYRMYMDFKKRLRPYNGVN